MRALVVKSLSLSLIKPLFILLSDMHGMGDLTTLKSSFFPGGNFQLKLEKKNLGVNAYKRVVVAVVVEVVVVVVVIVVLRIRRN